MTRALQCSIQAAAEQQPPADRDALDALNRLQSSLSLDNTTARDWERDLIRERRETGNRLIDNTQQTAYPFLTQPKKEDILWKTK